MSYLEATKTAPADADFVAYRNLGLGWSIAQRLPDGAFDTAAALTPPALSIFISGVSARRRSLWNYETKQFECGDLSQLTREA